MTTNKTVHVWRFVTLSIILLFAITLTAQTVAAKGATGSFGGGSSGVRGGGSFQLGVPVGCGNGLIDSGETCDDGNTNDFDGCDALCQLEPGCYVDDLTNTNYWTTSEGGCGGTITNLGNGSFRFEQQACEQRSWHTLRRNAQFEGEFSLELNFSDIVVGPNPVDHTSVDRVTTAISFYFVDDNNELASWMQVKLPKGVSYTDPLNIDALIYENRSYVDDNWDACHIDAGCDTDDFRGFYLKPDTWVEQTATVPATLSGNDGQLVLERVNNGGNWELYLKYADGIGNLETILAAPGTNSISGNTIGFGDAPLNLRISIQQTTINANETYDLNTGGPGFIGQGADSTAEFTYSVSGTNVICPTREEDAGFVQDIQCQIDGSWKECRNAQFGSIVTGMRTQCFSWDAFSTINRANLTLANTLAGVSQTLEATYNPNTTYVEGVFAQPVAIDKSGRWSVNTTCGQITAPVCSIPLPADPSTWVVPFGDYFDINDNFLITDGCCDVGALDAVETSTTDREHPARFHVANNPGQTQAFYDENLTCFLSANPCPDATTSLFGINDEYSMAMTFDVTTSLSLDMYVCCSPELVTYTTSGACSVGYDLLVSIEGGGLGRVSADQPPSSGSNTQICVAPLDTTEVLECTATTGVCSADSTCVYTYSGDPYSGGFVGSCNDSYPDMISQCCKRVDAP